MMNKTIFAVVGAAFVIIVTAAVLNGNGFTVPESRVDQLIALLIGGVTGGAIASPVAYNAGKSAGSDTNVSEVTKTVRIEETKPGGE